MDGEGTPSFQASRVRVRFAVGALLRGRVVPRRLSVDGGSLRAGERVVADAFGLTARLPDDVASGGAVAGRWSARVAGLPVRADADFVARRDGDGIEIASMDVHPGAGDITRTSGVLPLLPGRLFPRG